MPNHQWLNSLGQILIGTLSVYGIVLAIRIILSWVPIQDNRVTIILKKITDPVLDFFTKNFPINLAGFNISILIPFLIIGILSKLILDFMVGQYSINSPILYLLGLLIWAIRFFYDFFAFVIILFLVILLLIKISKTPSQHPLLTFIQNLINPIMLRLHKILKLKSRNGEIIYLVIILASAIIIALIGDNILKYLYMILDYYSKQVHVQKDMIDTIFERD